MTRVAYLIGVPEYLESDSYPALPAVRNDIKRMRDALESSGYQVLEHPTKAVELSRSRILSKLETIAGNAPAETVLVYFSGHGSHLHGCDFMVPHDAPRKVSPQYFISWDDIRGSLDESKAKTVILVADACRNLLESESVKLEPLRNVAKGAADTTVIRIYSCAPAEYS